MKFSQAGKSSELICKPGSYLPSNPTRRLEGLTISVDREQAGQFYTKESVLMQMTLSKRAREKKGGEAGAALRKLFSSLEDAERLFHNTLTALPSAKEEPGGLCLIHGLPLTHCRGHTTARLFA